MSNYNIVFLGVFFFLSYLVFVLVGRSITKKWNFGISKFSIFIAICSALPIAYASDFYADEHVKKNIPHEVKEVILSEQKIDDVVRSREKEGSFFFGIGDVKERETFRYSVINQDGTISRVKIYTSDCLIQKAENKERKVVYVKNVRIYKNSDDEKWWKNMYDSSDGFYRVYIL